MAGPLVPQKVKLLLVVMALKLFQAGAIIVSRAALDMGFSQIVFMIYKSVIALLLLAPFAYFAEKEDRPPLTFSLLVQFFLLALSGVTATLGLSLLALYYLSPTFISAILNSIPAITFALAAALRLELVNITKIEGLAKVVGTIASIGGAILITLYKGPLLLHRQLPNPSETTPFLSTSPDKIKNWTLGCVLTLGSCISYSVYLVQQVPVLKKYPANLTVSTFTFFFGVIQILIIAAFLETDIQYWKIHSVGELLTILYSGIVTSGISLPLQTWCIATGGPFLVAVFQPVSTIAVAIMASLIFGDQLYSGGVIGAIIIVIGLYLVLWGKSKDNIVGNKDKRHLTKPLIDGGDSHNDGAAVAGLPYENPTV